MGRTTAQSLHVAAMSARPVDSVGAFVPACQNAVRSSAKYKFLLTSASFKLKFVDQIKWNEERQGTSVARPVEINLQCISGHQ